MTYNIHPILVHFPIALLFLYSIIKILPFKKWFPNVQWNHIERALLSFGVLGAFAADATGSLAQHLVHPNHQLVDAHSTFAAWSTFLYCILLAGEVASVIRSEYGSKIHSKILHKLLALCEKILCNPIFSKIVALLGFVAISVTGLLGGTMVYGITADPLANIVLKLLGINL